MSDNYIGCPECCSFASAKSQEDSEELAKSHNNSRHGGEQVAHPIVPDSKDSLNDFMDEARELASRKQYERLIRRYTRKKTPFEMF